MPYTCDNPEEWYNACRSDNPHIYNLAYEILRQRLFSIIHYTFASRSNVVTLAQDSTQEANYKIYYYLNVNKRILDEPKTFCSWHKTIVIREAIKLSKKWGRLETIPLEDISEPLNLFDDYVLEDDAFTKMMFEELPEVLKKSGLTDKEIQAVLGKYHQGQSDKKLAEIETQMYPEDKPVTPGTIRKRRATGMNKLRKSDYFKDWLG